MLKCTGYIASIVMGTMSSSSPHLIYPSKQIIIEKLMDLIGCKLAVSLNATVTVLQSQIKKS